MRKHSIAILGVLILSYAAQAGEPWKEKPYLQWDSNDIRKVLFESPWAQIVVVDAPWRSSLAAAQAAAAGTAPQPSGPYSMGGMQGAQPAPMSGGAAPNPEAGNQIPRVKFLVRWVSALAVREAMARSAILEGRMKEAEAAGALAQPTPGYVLLVAGPDMTPFADAEEMELQTSTFLKPKKSREKIAPSKVEIQRDPETKKVISVFFTFPTKTESGQATIGPDEKGAEFICMRGGLTIKTSFDLRKMADSQGREL
jgi:hypothetical protein